MSERRLTLYRLLMELYPEYVTQFPWTKLNEVLLARYRVWSVNLMTVEMLQDLVNHLQYTLHGRYEDSVKQKEWT